MVSQLLFLALFLVLVRRNKLQLWMPVFTVGVIFSFIFSRFYCGWMCPMETLFRPINWIYNRLGIKRRKTPKLFETPVIRYTLLGLMIGALALSFIYKAKVPILLLITVLSVILTLFFEEKFWHRHLCPYGTLLGLSARPSRLSVRIDEDDCTSCGLCQKVCPTGAIVTLESKKRRIVKNECLTCFKCQEVCPADVIHYQT